MLYFALQSTCAVIQYDLVWILYILDYNFSIFFFIETVGAVGRIFSKYDQIVFIGRADEVCHHKWRGL